METHPRVRPLVIATALLVVLGGSVAYFVVAIRTLPPTQGAPEIPAEIAERSVQEQIGERVAPSGSATASDEVATSSPALDARRADSPSDELLSNYVRLISGAEATAPLSGEWSRIESLLEEMAKSEDPILSLVEAMRLTPDSKLGLRARSVAGAMLSVSLRGSADSVDYCRALLVSSKEPAVQAMLVNALVLVPGPIVGLEYDLFEVFCDATDQNLEVTAGVHIPRAHDPELTTATIAEALHRGHYLVAAQIIQITWEEERAAGGESDSYGYHISWLCDLVAHPTIGDDGFRGCLQALQFLGARSAVESVRGLITDPERLEYTDRLLASWRQ